MPDATLEISRLTPSRVDVVDSTVVLLLEFVDWFTDNRRRCRRCRGFRAAAGILSVERGGAIDKSDLFGSLDFLADVADRLPIHDLDKDRAGN
jgi:hypothetical protein